MMDPAELTIQRADSLENVDESSQLDIQESNKAEDSSWAHLSEGMKPSQESQERMDGHAHTDLKTEVFDLSTALDPNL